MILQGSLFSIGILHIVYHIPASCNEWPPIEGMGESVRVINRLCGSDTDSVLKKQQASVPVLKGAVGSVNIHVTIVSNCRSFQIFSCNVVDERKGEDVEVMPHKGAKVISVQPENANEPRLFVVDCSEFRGAKVSVPNPAVPLPWTEAASELCLVGGKKKQIVWAVSVESKEVQFSVRFSLKCEREGAEEISECAFDGDCVNCVKESMKLQHQAGTMEATVECKLPGLKVATRTYKLECDKKAGPTIKKLK